MKKLTLFLLSTFFITSISASCASMNYNKTVQNVDLARFLTKWYVIGGRLTFMENGAHNAVEEYTYNVAKDRIDINFYFNKDSFSGPLKKIPQKAWITNRETNAHWKVSPFWPIKFDYLVIALAPDYSWTVIGVPDQKYIWIMSQDWNMSEAQLQQIITEVQTLGYSVENIVRTPQKW